MTRSVFLPLLLLALPLAAAAQTTPTPGQVTEVTEELDPKTGKVIRRTTRTTTAPAGTTAPASSTTTATATASASDAVVSSFLKEKTVVSSLTTTGLLSAYGRLMDRVHTDRYGWKPADWDTAAAVLSSLNARYDQLRPNFTLDDKITIRTQQAEFQTLRTARQVSDQVSEKL